MSVQESDGSLWTSREEEVKLKKTLKHNIEAVVDRLVIREDIKGRLTESIEQGAKTGRRNGHHQCHRWGKIRSSLRSSPVRSITSGWRSWNQGFSSFNAPYGKCEHCDGLGTLLEIDENLVIPDRTKSIMDGAMASWVTVD